MIGRRIKGFTLIEVMMACLCLALILGPITMVLRSGMQTSMKGMLQVSTTQEARRILQQIHDDLKSACYPFSMVGSINIGLEVFLRKLGNPLHPDYQIYRFPLNGSVNEVVELNDPRLGAPRLASKVTYKMESSADPKKRGLYTLSREETFHPHHPMAGTPLKRVLSDNVNEFRIEAETLESGGFKTSVYYVYIRLVDSINGVPVNVSTEERSRDIMIADYFDVVVPSFFNSLNAGHNRNWSTYVEAPSD